MDYISEVYWDKGGRSVNQDSVSLQELWLRGEKAVLVLVCDGIGGLPGGEEASGFVTEKMTEWFYREAAAMLAGRKHRGRILQSGLRVLYTCNENFLRKFEEKGIKMGTTITALLLYRGQYCLWHSGDTRAYRIRRRGAQMIQLTKDHTRGNHVLIRCIGSFAWQQPDTACGRLGRKEVLLICSDGFWNRLTEDRMGEALGSRGVIGREQLAVVLKELGEYVKRHGEADNISAAAVKRI